MCRQELHDTGLELAQLTIERDTAFGKDAQQVTLIQHLARVRKSGLSHLVDIQVRVDGELTVREGHDIAHAVKDALIASAPHTITDVTVHIEPAK